MPEPQFAELVRALLHGGVASRHVGRTVAELQDHFADIEEEALVAGLSPQEAAAEALLRIGSQEAIASGLLAHEELKSWSYRWPWAFYVVRPLLLAVLIPLMPIIVCTERGDAIARWGIAICFGAVLTGSLLFFLQLGLLG